MKVSRYDKFDNNEGVEVSRQQHERGMSHQVDLYGGDADDVASEADDQPLASSPSSSRKMSKGKVLCLTGLFLFLVIGASVGGYVARTSRSSASASSAVSEAEADDTTAQPKGDVFCQPTSIKDTKAPFLEMNIASGELQRLLNETEGKELERAVMEGYNEASGGCNDEYERWIYGKYYIFIVVVCSFSFLSNHHSSHAPILRTSFSLPFLTPITLQQAPSLSINH
jgi:hypothetical protein